MISPVWQGHIELLWRVDSMHTSSVHSLSLVENGGRFDASFHLSEGIAVKRYISKSPYSITTIGDVSSSIFYGNRAKRVYVTKEENGIPFLSSSDILQSDISSVKLASKKYTTSKEQLKLDKGWILISRSGTIGNTAWTNSIHAQKLASEHVIRVVPNNELQGGFVYAYLTTKYGYSLLTQGTFGAVIQHIEPDFVASIPIPVFPESFRKQVNELIIESACLREKANDALLSAKRVLNEFLSIDFTKQAFKTAIVSSKDILSSLQERIDPPALINDGVGTMTSLISSKPYKRIGEIKATVHRPGIFKRCYVKEGIPYIKGSEIFLMNPFLRCEQLSRTKTPFVDEMALKEGQILITCAGSVGCIKMITKEYEDKRAIGSQDIIRLMSQDVLYTREYLFTYLQLPFVYEYIQSMKYGSVIERIEPFHVESIPVIEPSKEISQQITALIRQYMDYTYRAFNAEETAIKLVEHEIESWNS